MKNYPTDEELNAFLEKLEQQELYAPEHLKEEIMKKVFPSELPRTEEKRTVPFAVYVLKMAAGMAAALTLLIVNPFRDGSDISRAGLLQEEDRPRITREDLNDPEYRAKKPETLFDRLNNSMREAKEKIMANDL